jgi:hypothetical protein
MIGRSPCSQSGRGEGPDGPMAGSSSGPFSLREIDDLAGSGGRPNNSPILTQIKVPTSGDFSVKARQHPRM